jgi:hypothetical protein
MGCEGSASLALVVRGCMGREVGIYWDGAVVLKHGLIWWCMKILERSLASLE